jgi:hypothetical protein
MKPILSRNRNSILFILTLTLAGVSLSYTLVNELSSSHLKGMIFTTLSLFATAISLGLSIYSKHNNNN